MSLEECLHLNMNKQEFCLRGRNFKCTSKRKPNELFKVNVQQRRSSEAEVEMDGRSWERRNSDIAIYETNQQLESQRLELYQANQWADQAQRKTIDYLENRVYQEHHAKDYQ